MAHHLSLYADYKHYHWQTFGPLFRDLHLFFDEFANAVLPTAAGRGKLANDDNDSGTVDLFSRTVQLHEKHEWFLRQILVQKDGLTS